jgi:tetratricopeptide (TPR) repeat protein
VTETVVSDHAKKYSTSNQVVNGVLKLLEETKVEEAADLYSHCQEDIGFLLMAKSNRERPFQARLAKMFFTAKDYEKAAMVLEANGEVKRAAELYERTDMYEQAAEMWLKLGDIQRAALNYEKLGSWQKAADFYAQVSNFVKAAYCFEKAINHFLAGKYYMEIGKFQKSMELLQKVRREDKDFLDATVLIGEILSKHGYPDIAESKYRSVIKTLMIGQDNLIVYYRLAALLETKGNLHEAGALYKQIAEVDPGFQDVAERVKACAVQVAEEPKEVEQLEEVEEEMELVGNVQSLSEDVLARQSQQVTGATKPRNQIVSLMDGFEFLKATPLFESLSLSEMKRLWTICEEKFFKPGTMLIEQFQQGRALYVVKQGGVVVQRVDGDKVTDLVRLAKGACVGEMSLINQAATSARVIAGPGGAEVFEITRDRFDELLASDDKIAIKLYKVFIDTLCERLRKTTEDLAAAKSK